MSSSLARFTSYAQQQMARRGISTAEVEAVLAAPAFRRANYGFREEVYGQTLDGRTLKVIVAEGSAPVIVINAMPVSARRVGRLRGRHP
jgi:hypothetical protein